MKIEEFNELLRGLFQQILNDGHKKHHICGLTLGAQNAPQFDNFLKGNDFGIKPLQRIVENAGYAINIVISKAEDPEMLQFTRQVNSEFLNTCKSLLVERLNDKSAIKSASVPKTGLIAEISNDLFDEIINS
jgi:hypothetical protein